MLQNTRVTASTVSELLREITLPPPPRFGLTNICLKKYLKKYLGQKKIRKILLQINSSYFSKMVLHNSRNKTMASV